MGQATAGRGVFARLHQCGPDDLVLFRRAVDDPALGVDHRVRVPENTPLDLDIAADRQPSRQPEEQLVGWHAMHLDADDFALKIGDGNDLKAVDDVRAHPRKGRRVVGG